MLSVIIHTKNEAKNIKRAIDSIKDIADEILVVDMQSTDKTCQIAQAASKKIKILKYKKQEQFADPARNWAISKASGDWVLILDADEEISQNLKIKVLKLIHDDSQDIDVFYLPRKNIIFDKFIEHTGWWPDYQPRLFKKGHLNWPGKVHARPLVTGQFEYLSANPKSAIVHRNYQNIKQYINKLNRYTDLASGQKKWVQDSFLQVFFREFLLRFFLQEGYQDQSHGVLLSLLQSNYELVLAAKDWEKGDFKERQTNYFLEFRKIQQELNYWLADYQFKKNKNLIKKFYWRLRRKFRI